MNGTRSRFLPLGLFSISILGCAPAGGPVSGAPESHCGATVQKVNQQAACAASDIKAYGYSDTLHNSEGDDDDCKYHLTWTSTSIETNKDVTFSLTVTAKTDGSPVVGAKPYAEIFLTDVHPAPNSQVNDPVETSPGVYKIGAYRFDAAGQWTTRFHLFGNCPDTPDSPHGHAAFFVHLP